MPFVKTAIMVTAPSIPYGPDLASLWELRRKSVRAQAPPSLKDGANMIHEDALAIGDVDIKGLSEIATLLKDRFGEDAKAVAEIQLREADISSRSLWEFILSKLSE